MERVVDVRVIGPYRLYLVFADGIEGEVDLEHELNFTGVFAPLKDPVFFAQVRINDIGETIEWPNEADIAPETLYDLVVGYCVHEEAKPTKGGKPSAARGSQAKPAG